jgi:lysozyme
MEIVTLEELLIREEGKKIRNGRHVAYQDHLGYWTIGYGQLIDERKGGGLTEKQARMLLQDAIVEKESELDAHLPWWRNLSETRRIVLIAMAFQLGTDGVLQFKNTLAALQSGDYLKAANGIRSSLWAQQTPNRARRMALAIETDTLT